MCLNVNKKTKGRVWEEMEKITVAVFFGGCSPEYSVSLQSAAAVLEALPPEGYKAVAVGITREGRWLRYTGDLERLPANSWLSDEAACTPCTLHPPDTHSL